MDYQFKLRFDEIPEELLDQKFEHWKWYMEQNDPEGIEDKSEDELRVEFEELVQEHFPVYF